VLRSAAHVQGPGGQRVGGAGGRAVGGKAGGKGATSVGSGTDVSKVEEGFEVAVKYLEKLKI